ncbi:MAG: hypothetical protein EBR32_02885 [Bacteroidetes bacterium]|nr:hypothetical protein [Bacteroidota bacterium]
MRLFTFLLTLIFFLTNEVIFAQPALPLDPNQAPIDGGLGLLAAAGGAYAYKKLKEKKKGEEELGPE